MYSIFILLLISDIICPRLLSTTATYQSHTSPMRTAEVHQPHVIVFLGHRLTSAALNLSELPLADTGCCMSSHGNSCRLSVTHGCEVDHSSSWKWLPLLRSVFAILPGLCKHSCSILVLHHQTCCPSCNLCN